MFNLKLIIIAYSPLEKDLLGSDEDTFFKVKAEVFTEFIEKNPPLWSQIIVEHYQFQVALFQIRFPLGDCVVV